MDKYQCNSCRFEIKLIDNYVYEGNSTAIKSRLCTVIFKKNNEVKIIDLLSKKYNPQDYKIIRKDEIRIFACPICSNKNWELLE